MTIEPIVVQSVTCCDLKKAFRSETEVGLSVELTNPNAFPINLKSYCLDVRINGNTIGTTEDKQVTQIAANSTIEKPFVITASTQQLIGGTLMMGLSALMGNDPTTLNVEVVGSVVGNAKGVSKRVKIRESYPLKLHP